MPRASIKSGSLWRSLGTFLFLALFLGFQSNGISHAQSLDLAINGYGLSFGNSKKFNGLRLNFRDSHVESVNGVNITLARPENNDQAVVRGLSLGVSPGAGDMYGLGIGALGPVAEKQLKGIGLGLLAAGAGGNASGVMIGGLAAGAGADLKGIAVGGFAAGSGATLTGIAAGGFAAGAGADLKGIAVGGFAAGSGATLTGIAVGGLAAGCGTDLKGIAVGGLAAGCGVNLTGIALGGLGAGCGEHLRGFAAAGIEVVAREIDGVALAGFRTRGEEVKGVTLALGWVKVSHSFAGFTVSAFNQIKGKQTGVSLGIVNYARQLEGVQIGLINYVQDHPKYRKVLPVINANF